MAHTLLMLILASIIHLAPANAHELRPSIVTLQYPAIGTYELQMTTNLEAIIAEIGAGHEETTQSPNADLYDQLVALSPAELEAAFEADRAEILTNLMLRFDSNLTAVENVTLEIPETVDPRDGRVSTIILRGSVAEDASFATWQLAPAYGDSVFRVRGADGEVGYAAFLENGEQSEIVALAGLTPRSFSDVLIEFVSVGFAHIIPMGLDHIVFVIGLFLLSQRLRPLLIQVTAFTLAHSITLALAMTGTVSAPGSIVEPLIAASIVFVAVENVMSDKLSRLRPIIVFLFGLLHGLGFAGALTEFGLAKGDFWPGLIGFNIGVELGQLAVIAICFALFGYWFRDKPWYRSRITIPASIAIATLGTFWFVERVFF